MTKMQFTDEILIPRQRVAMLLGPKNATKLNLEKLGKVKISVKENLNSPASSRNGKRRRVFHNLVEIAGKDALEVMVAKNVVDAIGRGFSPESAKQLFDDEFSYTKLVLPDYGHKKASHQTRIKGVVIGQEGKAKRMIERESGAELAIQGKTIAILGKYEAVEKARQAVEMLLTGRRHATVYRFLERTNK